MLSGYSLPCFSENTGNTDEMIVCNEVIKDSNILNITGKSEFRKIYLQFWTMLKSVGTNVYTL